MKSAVVISGSADLGSAAIEHWLDQGWSVTATYRRHSDAVKRLEDKGAKFIHADLNDHQSVERSVEQLLQIVPQWDVLMTCPATMEPIAPFLACDWNEWAKSVDLNFTQQMRYLHALLPRRRVVAGDLPPMVMLWAGPGTNNAPLNYTAEIAAKIAQIKMCELLDAEIQDCRFTIIGPGWVKTKIHDETIKAGEYAGTNFERTREMIESDRCTPMERVIRFIDWALSQEKAVVSGRNFSVVHDIWGNSALSDKLAATPDAFKLRRFLNDWKEDR